jgi:hypothetical protein
LFHPPHCVHRGLLFWRLKERELIGSLTRELIVNRTRTLEEALAFVKHSLVIQ